jgi:hypothetical protein
MVRSELTGISVITKNIYINNQLLYILIYSPIIKININIISVGKQADHTALRKYTEYSIGPMTLYIYTLYFSTYQCQKYTFNKSLYVALYVGRTTA